MGRSFHTFFHLEKGIFLLRHQGIYQIVPAQLFIGFHAPFQLVAFFQPGTGHLSTSDVGLTAQIQTAPAAGA